jgi:hypothetical protein
MEISFVLALNSYVVARMGYIDLVISLNRSFKTPD